MISHNRPQTRDDGDPAAGARNMFGYSCKQRAGPAGQAPPSLCLARPSFALPSRAPAKPCL
jgi:hypothetical protein